MYCIYAKDCCLNARSQVYLCTHIMFECSQAAPYCALAQLPLGPGGGVVEILVLFLAVVALVQVGLLDLQLLSAHHCWVDGGVARAMELPQVDLEPKKKNKKTRAWGHVTRQLQKHQNKSLASCHQTTLQKH